MKFSYSYDEEGFNGEFESREIALAEAIKNRPESKVIWTGLIKEQSAKNFVDIDSVFENMQFSADDLCGEVAEDWLFNVKPEKKQELEDIITKFVDENWPIRFWLVKDVQEHKLEPRPSTERMEGE